jgi:hypothetical protein
MRWCTVLLLVSCAHSQIDVGGKDVADLSNRVDARALHVAWQWQPTKLAADGAAIPPNPKGWLTLDPSALIEPRGGQRLSAVWYRTRITLSDAHAGHRVLIGMSIDDYGEILVDGEVKALANGFNGEVIAELARTAVIGESHEIVVLGVNSPLGDPPERPVFRNEVFVRRPIRVILDGNMMSPPSSTIATAPIEPKQMCAVRIEGDLLRPTINDLDRICDPPTNDGPRWLRYDVDMAQTQGLLRVMSNGYAEVWLNGSFRPTFARGYQSSVLQSGRNIVDILVWPAPFASPTGDTQVTVQKSP